ncbi:MAG TPA: aminotransferase class I/II-fold pyridoxal phosphate-dependent enzyme [Blastocatellia bacterium]|nr:aminotransferase class I/II-fold pyridoxal phosphate-dependent enzyme [Blastocatellia bacterium]
MSFTPAERLKDVRKSATRRLFDSAPPGSINLGLGEPDFPTPEFVQRAAIQAIQEGRVGYTANAGLVELREKIAAYHNEGLGGKSSQPYTSDSVCVTTGAEEALFAVVMAMAGPGDEVLLPDPGFNAYPTIVELAGARVTTYRMPAARGFAFDRDLFVSALSDETRLVFVLSPSNPTSRTISRDDLAFIADRLRGRNVWIVTDEIYRELYFDERPGSISEFYDQTIVVSGVSKMMSMTGWRLGWAAGPEEVIRHVTVMHQYVSTCASRVSQKAALAAFTEEGRRATAGMRDELRRRRDVISSAIERHVKLPYVTGEGAFYAMLDVSEFDRPSEEIAMALLGSRVITVPGSAFGVEGEGHLRLSFCIEPREIEEGVRRIASGLAKKTA